MSSPRPLEVFLSHSDLDRDLAESVADLLARHGVPVWFSRQRLQGAQNWHDEIGDALNRCDWVIRLATPNAIASRWVRLEVGFVVRTPRFDGRLIPLLVEPCDLQAVSWTLPQIQYIDFSDFERGMRQLLATWGIGFRP